MAATYKCASVGCYSYQSPETNTLFQKLQATVNQFAKALSFTPLKVDGIIGRGTTEATLLVLLFLGETDKGPVGASATALEAGINTTEQLVVNVQAVVDTLVLSTKQSAIAAQTTPPQSLPAPTAEPTIAQKATTSANAPVASTSAAVNQRLDLIQQRKPSLKPSLINRMPPWAAYAGGIALVVGTIAGVMVINKRKGRGKSLLPAAAIAGWGTRLLGSGEANREGLTWEEWRNAARVADPSGLHPEKIKAWRRAWKRGIDPTEMGQS